MQKRNYKIFGCILAIFLLLSGMCLENVKAHSLFESASLDNVVSLSASPSQGISYDESFTVEMLGIHHWGNIISGARMSGYKNETRASLVLFCEVLPILDVFQFYITEDTVFLSEKCCKTVILNYIHNTDGKK